METAFPFAPPSEVVILHYPCSDNRTILPVNGMAYPDWNDIAEELTSVFFRKMFEFGAHGYLTEK